MDVLRTKKESLTNPDRSQRNPPQGKYQTAAVVRKPCYSSFIDFSSFFLLNHTSDLMRQQGNSGPVFEFCFFCFCFRGNNHNSSDLCKKYSEISLYKYSLQNKHIYTYLCTCRLFTNIDQKISASSDRVPINCNEEEVKPKLQSEKEVCLFFRRGCSLFLFFFSDKNSTFFSESVTVLSSLI